MYSVYGQPNCADCKEVKRLLEENNLTYRYHDVTESDGAIYGFKANFPGRKTVPAIGYIDFENFLDFKPIGGLKELREWLHTQKS